MTTSCLHPISGHTKNGMVVHLTPTQKTPIDLLRHTGWPLKPVVRSRNTTALAWKITIDSRLARKNGWKLFTEGYFQIWHPDSPRCYRMKRMRSGLVLKGSGKERWPSDTGAIA